MISAGDFRNGALNYGVDYCDAGGRSYHYEPVPNTWGNDIESCTCNGIFIYIINQSYIFQVGTNH